VNATHSFINQNWTGENDLLWKDKGVKFGKVQEIHNCKQTLWKPNVDAPMIVAFVNHFGDINNCSCDQMQLLSGPLHLNVVILVVRDPFPAI